MASCRLPLEGSAGGRRRKKSRKGIFIVCKPGAGMSNLIASENISEYAPLRSILSSTDPYNWMEFDGFGFNGKASRAVREFHGASKIGRTASLLCRVGALCWNPYVIGRCSHGGGTEDRPGSVPAGRAKVPNRKISAWQAERNDKKIAFLKAGVGPKRAAASLEEALHAIPCSHVLVIGYAGALDPGLKVGDLVAGRAGSGFQPG